MKRLIKHFGTNHLSRSSFYRLEIVSISSSLQESSKDKQLVDDKPDIFAIIREHAASARQYAMQNGLSSRYCILVDYSIPSGTPRLFLWSFSEDKVIYKGYAMHGSGLGSTAETPEFSNKVGSNCSSPGRFIVTKEHGRRNKTGSYLKGLDMSDLNARRRAIMIHSSPWADHNKGRKYIPLNPKCCQGCVTVSTKEMNYLGRIISDESKNILLWSYCS